MTAFRFIHRIISILMSIVMFFTQKSIIFVSLISNNGCWARVWCNQVWNLARMYWGQSHQAEEVHEKEAVMWDFSWSTFKDCYWWIDRRFLFDFTAYEIPTVFLSHFTKIAQRRLYNWESDCFLSLLYFPIRLIKPCLKSSKIMFFLVCFHFRRLIEGKF